MHGEYNVKQYSIFVHIIFHIAPTCFGVISRHLQAADSKISIKPAVGFIETLLSAHRTGATSLEPNNNVPSSILGETTNNQFDAIHPVVYIYLHK